MTQHYFRCLFSFCFVIKHIASIFCINRNVFGYFVWSEASFTIIFEISHSLLFFHLDDFFSSSQWNPTVHFPYSWKRKISQSQHQIDWSKKILLKQQPFNHREKTIQIANGYVLYNKKIEWIYNKKNRKNCTANISTTRFSR